MSNNATYYEELEDPTTGRNNNNNNMKYNLVPNTNIKRQPKCCGCRRKTCIITFIVINLLIIGGFALYLFSKGAFQPVKHIAATCPNLSKNHTTKQQRAGYCTEPNTGVQLPIFMSPLAYNNNNDNTHDIIQQQLSSSCLIDNSDNKCNTLTGMNVVTNTFLGKVMVVGLYIDATVGKTKLLKYKNVKPMKIYSDALKNELISGDMTLTLEWNFVLSSFSPVPISIMATHFKGNIKPYLVKYGTLTTDEINDLLNIYISRCFPSQQIDVKDAVQFTWNVKDKSLSCNFNNNPEYKSITNTMKGINLLSKAIFEFTLDYNKDYVVDLLPNLWTWN